MSIEKSWPDDTFVWEDENQEHYCGSHWEVFFDSPDEILQSLPEIIPDLVHLPTFGGFYTGPRESPAGRATGAQLCWPNIHQGFVVTLRVTEGSIEFMNMSPFQTSGIQVDVEVRHVHVWASGAEARIEGVWGESPIAFHDYAYIGNRTWYEAGKRCEFILTGIACRAGPPKVDKLPLASDSRLAEWQRTWAELTEEQATFIGLEGSRIFFLSRTGIVMTTGFADRR